MFRKRPSTCSLRRVTSASSFRGKECSPQFRFQLTDAQHQEIREVFDMYDNCRSDALDGIQLGFAIRALGFEPKPGEINALMEASPNFDNGTIDFDEFSAIMTEKIANRDPMEEVLKTFNLFHGNHADGAKASISFADLKRVATELGEDMTDDELHGMISMADENGDGQVTQHEFVKIMRKTNMLDGALNGASPVKEVKFLI